MRLPSVGDVIRYAYLWSHERDGGREEATKDRPAAVVALIRRIDGTDEVVVLPITSQPPLDPGAAVEIPEPTRLRLGLPRQRCWVVVSEFNHFAWPGPDLRPLEGGGILCGPLPASLMASIRASFQAWRASRGIAAVRRTE